MSETDSGWLKIRKGILDHLADGRMDFSMFTAYMIMLSNCDYSTGLCMGCARRLRSLMGEQWSLKKCRRTLADLSKAKYITFHRKPGLAAEFYPIEINNYIPLVGPQKGQKLRMVEAGFKGGRDKIVPSLGQNRTPNQDPFSRSRSQDRKPLNFFTPKELMTDDQKREWYERMHQMKL